MLELTVIIVLGVGLVLTLAMLLGRRSAPVNESGVSKTVDLIAQAVQKVQAEQRATQEVQRDLKTELRSTSDNLKNLFTESQEREKRDQEHQRNITTIIRNVESVMRGSKSKGMAGENIIREILKIFPPDAMAYNVKVGSKVVEFGLKLPDGRIVPIDSKILAVDELAALDQSEDEAAKLRIIPKIEQLVLRQAREVS